MSLESFLITIRESVRRAQEEQRLLSRYGPTPNTRFVPWTQPAPPIVPAIAPIKEPLEVHVTLAPFSAAALPPPQPTRWATFCVFVGSLTDLVIAPHASMTLLHGRDEIERRGKRKKDS
jgi:hypothetical protein